MPARSHGVELRTSELLEAEPAHTLWSPWLGRVPIDYRGPVLSSGPQAGEPTRHGIGTAYVTPANAWGMIGGGSGWSVPGDQGVMRRQPTTKLAIGRGWLPFGSFGANGAPTPSLPEPARMVQPRLR